MTTIGDASIYAPNTYFSDFTARKLSNPALPRHRVQPGQPGHHDLHRRRAAANTNSSSLELLDVSQVEFVRGPQSALFGRNTLGGLVNVSSARPSLTQVDRLRASSPSATSRPSTCAPMPRGRSASKAARRRSRSAMRSATASRPTTSPGTTSITATALFGKAQLLLTPTASWEARVIYQRRARPRRRLRAERSRRAAQQAASRRARLRRPHQPRRHATTFLARHAGRGADVHVDDRIRPLEDRRPDRSRLHAAAADHAQQRREETRSSPRRCAFASAPAAPRRSCRTSASLKWQAGLFLFTQNYEQDAVNNFSPFVLSPFIPFPVAQHSPASGARRLRASASTARARSRSTRLDITARRARSIARTGRRDLRTFFVAPVPSRCRSSSIRRSRSRTCRRRPRCRSASARTRWCTSSVTGGFKAGGFNPRRRPGSEAYGEEKTWNVEGGVKTRVGGRAASPRISPSSRSTGTICS